MNSINVSTSLAKPCSTLFGSTLIREGRVSVTQRSCSTNSSVCEVSMAGSANWGSSGENVIRLLRNAFQTQGQHSQKCMGAMDRWLKSEDLVFGPATSPARVGNPKLVVFPPDMKPPRPIFVSVQLSFVLGERLVLIPYVARPLVPGHQRRVFHFLITLV